jgi:hypothetical protein
MYSKGLPDLKSSHRLAALLVIVACQLFENENSDQSQVTASMIRDRVFGLYEEVRCSSGGYRDLRNEVKWWKLFIDLGIKLKFPPSRFQRAATIPPQ